MVTAWKRLVGAIALSFLAAACLPDDTRPPPGSLFVSAQASAATSSGFETADGWMVRFDCFLAALGDIELDGDDCVSYGRPRYNRVFDFAVPNAPQKVGLAYALGTCGVEFEMDSPDEDALLGENVTQADLDFMREGNTDPYVEDEEEEERVSVFASGSATNGATTKRFAWKFLLDYEMDECKEHADDTEESSEFEVTADDALRQTIVMQGEELFRESLDDGAVLRFQPLADADADGDDDVTLGELALVAGPALPEEIAGLTPEDDPSLSDLIYLALVPRVPRIDGRVCTADLDRGGGGPGPR